MNSCINAGIHVIMVTVTIWRRPDHCRGWAFYARGSKVLSGSALAIWMRAILPQGERDAVIDKSSRTQL